MKLYFTRHGKTEWNQERRFQGMNGDSPLLPASHEEIRLLGQCLKDVPFEAIYASPSKRASDTAKGIQQELAQFAEIIYDENLREMGYGELEGQKIDDMYEKYGEDLINLRHHLDRYDPSAFRGEETQAMLTRMTQAIDTAIAAHEGPILFVGHGASLTAAIRHLIGKPLAELRSEGGLLNNSLTILEAKEQQPHQLLLWNDVHFLEQDQ